MSQSRHFFISIRTEKIHHSLGETVASGATAQPKTTKQEQQQRAATARGTIV
jgi:hypothetical protein